MESCCSGFSLYCTCFSEWGGFSPAIAATFNVFPPLKSWEVKGKSVGEFCSESMRIELRRIESKETERIALEAETIEAVKMVVQTLLGSPAPRLAALHASCLPPRSTAHPPMPDSFDISFLEGRSRLFTGFAVMLVSNHEAILDRMSPSL